ncbi:MAG: alginate lyase family protein [Phycisphaerales bacterium]|nr:alginate lyase family protein [Phycisphaerales bacterium]
MYHADTRSFSFLNRTKVFEQKIDWDFCEFGLLWAFKLHYFDWLNDTSISVESKIDSILQYIDNHNDSEVYQHSFPASLRIVNWIKFLMRHQIGNKKILDELFSQSYRLSSFPEYELMGNHLLENGIALLWAGFYFDEARFWELGKTIVEEELAVQILADGCHFEKSPSYHSILLKNLLELLFLFKRCDIKIISHKTLEINISRMLSCLFVLSDGRNDYPNFGDSNSEMAISFYELNSLAQDLGIALSAIALGESGYRRYNGLNYQLFFNCGNIISNFQPGHSHADAFSFCLYTGGVPIIVDRGVSTYELTDLRLVERSTQSHNTISVASQNSADVWASFRMGKRPDIKIIKEDNNYIKCIQDGYFNSFDILHKREISAFETSVEITDELLGWKGQNSVLYLHFSSDVSLSFDNQVWYIEGTSIKIYFQNCDTRLDYYQYCKGFNEVVLAPKIVAVVKNKIIKTIIEI